MWVKNNLQEQAMAETSYLKNCQKFCITFLIDSSSCFLKKKQSDIIFGIIVQLFLLSCLQQAQLLNYV